MEQFFLRAVKAQLPVKANTDLSHRPASETESLFLTALTVAFLRSTIDLMRLKRSKSKKELQHWRRSWKVHFKTNNTHRLDAGLM